jgi:1-deoxy-D-xylulose 5-phosphate reductoisomerase
MKKNVSILGSNTPLSITIIEFFKKYTNKYNIVGITYDSKLDNLDIFLEQIKIITPKCVYVDRREDYDKIQAKEISDKVNVFFGEESFIKFIKSTEIDIVVSSLRGSSSVKKILSSIYEYKDITLLDSSPLLYSGYIIVQEARSKGVSLNVFTYPIYSLAQFLKSRKINDIYSVDFFSSKHKDKIKDIDPDDYKTYFEFLRQFHSINKTKILFESYLANYLYNIPISKVSFYEQSKPIISIAVQFKDGSNLLNITNKDIENIFNYYFLDSDLLMNQKYISSDSLAISINKLNINDYKLLQLGINALEKGGSIPIIFYLILDKLTELIYSKNIKPGMDIYKIIEEIINDKDLYNKKPDLSLIYAFEKNICEKLNVKCLVKEKKKL